MTDEAYGFDYLYEHENNCNYFVIDEDINQDDLFQIKMLIKNNLKNFLKINIQKINGQSRAYYEITARQQMYKLYEYRKMTLEDVEILCRNISDAVNMANAYMLDIDRIVLEPQHIYVNMYNKIMDFVYYIGSKEMSFSDSIKALFEYVLKHFDHSESKESVVLIYDIYKKIIVQDYNPGCLYNLFDNGVCKNNGYIKEDYIKDNYIKNNYVKNDYIKDDYIKDDEDAVMKNYEFKDNRAIYSDKVMENEKLQGKVKQQKEGYTVLNTVVNETDKQDTEIEDKKMKNILKGAKVAAVVIVINGMLAIFAPAYALLKLSFIKAMVSIAFGIILFTIVHKIYGKNRGCFIKNVLNKESIPYTIKKETTVEKVIADTTEIDTTNVNNISECTSDLLYNENIVTNNNTVLLTDYIGESKRHLLSLKLIRKEDIEQLSAPEHIQPDKYPYVIGNSEESSDCCIESRVVSRIHLRIAKTDDKYYIEDMNSTNGTYINEKRLNPLCTEPINNNDILKIAVYSYKVEIT